MSSKTVALRLNKIADQLYKISIFFSIGKFIDDLKFETKLQMHERSISEKLFQGIPGVIPQTQNQKGKERLGGTGM